MRTSTPATTTATLTRTALNEAPPVDWPGVLLGNAPA